MSRRLRCPSCQEDIGVENGDDVKLRLVVTLVDRSGNVHGPCHRCKADVVLYRGGQLVPELLAKAHPRRRVEFVITED